MNRQDDTDLETKKKSILASANTKLAKHGHDIGALLDDRVNEEEENDFQKQMEENISGVNNQKSKLPVPTGSGPPPPPMNPDNQTDVEPNSEKTMGDLLKNMKATKAEKIPRFNPNLDRVKPVVKNDFLTENEAPTTSNTNTALNNVPNPPNPNYDTIPASADTKPPQSGNQESPSNPTLQQSEKDNSANLGSEQIPLQNIHPIASNPFNRSYNSPKNSPARTRDPSKVLDTSLQQDTSAKDAVKSKLLLKGGSEKDDKTLPEPDRTKDESYKGNEVPNVPEKETEKDLKPKAETKIEEGLKLKDNSKSSLKEDKGSKNKKPLTAREEKASKQNESSKTPKDKKDAKQNERSKGSAAKDRKENSKQSDSNKSTPSKGSIGDKDKLSVPSTGSLNQTTEKKESKPAPPGSPRRENRLTTEKRASNNRGSREASPARSPARSNPESKNVKSNTKSNKETETETEKTADKDKETIKVATQIETSKDNEKPADKESERSSENEGKVEAVTARDVQIVETKKAEEEEAKETADNILNELGEKPRSILARAAMKKIASRNLKSNNVSGSAVDAKHVSVTDAKDATRNKFALSVPSSASGKRESVQGDDKDDKLSVGSRRDSTKYSIDSMSRKSVDIRMQNHIAMVNKQAEEKPKSPLTNTDSWIRSAIPYLPLGVAVLCLLLNILIPGSGTMLSGFAILCCGKPRVNSKDDHVIVTLCVNVWVGFAQLFTITFLLVGWFWSLAWGIRMVLLAVEFRRQQQVQREKQLQTMALSAFGSASNMRSLFP